MFIRILISVIALSLFGCGTPSQPERASGEGVAAELPDINGRNFGDHLKILAVSGGGHRAAHYALGMLMALDDMPLPDGATFLDSVDVVSSVSGGSYGIATYYASYLEDRCKRENNGKFESRPSGTLDLLKANRDRLRILASGWFPHLAKPVLDPMFWGDQLRNIDSLESNYFSNLVAIDNCPDLKILNTKHLSGKANYAIPFIHIVNATNSKTGKIFSFFDGSDSEFKFGQTYKTIGCTFWRGQNHKIIENRVPYSLALASSASFPPLVTDAIFGRGSNCEEGPYVRLTDGGQSDDNGIEAALEYAGSWLGADEAKDNRNALILSMDALVEATTETVESGEDENPLRIAVERNADLPRYSKKRSQKEELRTKSQTKSVSWENFSKSQALFGASIAFRSPKPGETVIKSETGTLGFANPKNPMHVSNISTFANGDGLNLQQQISGVAEGYFQTARKLVANDNKTELRKILVKAEQSAFDLYCSGEVDPSFLGDCFSYFSNADNRKILDPCFAQSGDRLIGKSHRGCHIGRFVQPEYAKAFRIFNDAQEQILFEKISSEQTNLVNSYGEKVQIEFGQVLNMRKAQIDSKLDEFDTMKENFLNAVEGVYKNLFKELIALSDINLESIAQFNSSILSMDKTIEDLKQAVPVLKKLNIAVVNLQTNKFNWHDVNEVNNQGVVACEYVSDDVNVLMRKPAEEQCESELAIRIKDQGFLEIDTADNPTDWIPSIRKEARIKDVSEWEEYVRGLLQNQIESSRKLKEDLEKIKSEKQKGKTATGIRLASNDILRKSYSLNDLCSNINRYLQNAKRMLEVIANVKKKDPGFLKISISGYNLADVKTELNLPARLRENGFCEFRPAISSAWVKSINPDIEEIVRTIQGVDELRSSFRKKLVLRLDDSVPPKSTRHYIVEFAESVRRFTRKLNLTQNHKSTIKETLEVILKRVREDGALGRKHHTVRKNERSKLEELRAQYDSGINSPQISIVFPTEIFKKNRQISGLPADTRERNLRKSVCGIATGNEECDITRGLKISLPAMSSRTELSKSLKKAAEKFASSAVGLQDSIYKGVSGSNGSRREKPNTARHGSVVVESDTGLTWVHTPKNYWECQIILEKSIPDRNVRDLYSIVGFLKFERENVTRIAGKVFPENCLAT